MRGESSISSLQWRWLAAKAGLAEREAKGFITLWCLKDQPPASFSTSFYSSVLDVKHVPPPQLPAWPGKLWVNSSSIETFLYGDCQQNPNHVQPILVYVEVSGSCGVQGCCCCRAVWESAPVVGRTSKKNYCCWWEDALDLLGSSGIAASMTWCVVCEVRYEEVQVMCSLHSLDFFTSFCRRRIVGWRLTPGLSARCQRKVGFLCEQLTQHPQVPFPFVTPGGAEILVQRWHLEGQRECPSSRPWRWPWQRSLCLFTQRSDRYNKWEKLFHCIPWVFSLGFVCVSCEGQRHDGVMLGDLGSLRVCKICMNSLGWWESCSGWA